MPFQNLRVNSEFFILHKDNTPYIEVGSVSGVSTPVSLGFLPAPACDAMERLERWLYWLIPLAIIARVISLCV